MWMPWWLEASYSSRLRNMRKHWLTSNRSFSSILSPISGTSGREMLTKAMEIMQGQCGLTPRLLRWILRVSQQYRDERCFFTLWTSCKPPCRIFHLCWLLMTEIVELTSSKEKYFISWAQFTTPLSISNKSLNMITTRPSWLVMHSLRSLKLEWRRKTSMRPVLIYNELKGWNFKPEEWRCTKCFLIQSSISWSPITNKQSRPLLLWLIVTVWEDTYILLFISIGRMDTST